MKKVANKKMFMRDIEKISKRKNCDIFNYYVVKDLFVVCKGSEQFVFDFSEYKSEKVIVKLIDEAIKTLNKKCFLQLDITNK